MSSVKQKIFNRPAPSREYRKVFTIFPEGEKTEKCYFTHLRKMTSTVNVIIKKGDKKNAPKQILSRAKKYIRENGISKNEQVWLVIDVDGREERLFSECLDWERADDKHGLAISNPKFEYWLLMHFESGNDVKNSTDCMAKLQRHLPNYDKGNIGVSKITKDNCKKAVVNGTKKHNGAEVLRVNCSTVYKLVDEILK